MTSRGLCKLFFISCLLVLSYSAPSWASMPGDISTKSPSNGSDKIIKKIVNLNLLEEPFPDGEEISGSRVHNSNSKYEKYEAQPLASSSSSSHSCDDNKLYSIHIPPYTWVLTTVLAYYFIELSMKKWSLKYKHEMIAASMQALNNRIENGDISGHGSSLLGNNNAIISRDLLPIDYFDIMQLFYVVGCLIYFTLLVFIPAVSNNDTHNSNSSVLNGWYTYELLVGKFMNSAVMTTFSAVLSDILVTHIPGYKDFFEASESVDVRIHRNFSNDRSSTGTGNRNSAHNQGSMNYANSMAHSFLHEEPRPFSICAFLYENYYSILIIVPIAIPFVTHCIVGMVLYFWIFLCVLVGFPVVYLLLCIVKDCIDGFIAMYILHTDTNFGTSEYFDLLRYSQSDRLIDGADVIVRLIVYFILSTSFNYAYLYYNLYHGKSDGYTPDAYAYTGVTDQEFEIRDSTCYYYHIFDSVESILVFFNFL